MTPSITPSPHTWTLRLKHNRSTILLHVDPLQNLHSVRAELLKAVRATNPSGSFHGHTIPQHESDILLARAVDSNDLTLGWESLEKGEEELELVEDRKGKGKASAVQASKDKMTDCPQGMGLKDGGVLAFKFRTGDDEARERGDEFEAEDELAGENLVGNEAAEDWDVVVPSMEETYGDVESGEGMEALPSKS
ncbi:hypothetical protein LTR62_007515 [Meristemomyces frigidus]|uniref:Uncharacterized protein n=1 Tax=Meristemomyces frigidus TaxID=1508187 RepID=A0AAN7TAY8_9PEZI|nr:hypothetical protein LTR62_007515 [Meristemomyces frigidus]